MISRPRSSSVQASPDSYNQRASRSKSLTHACSRDAERVAAKTPFGEIDDAVIHTLDRWRRLRYTCVLGEPFAGTSDESVAAVGAIVDVPA